MSGKTLDERITLLQEKYSEKDYPKMIIVMADQERRTESDDLVIKMLLIDLIIAATGLGFLAVTHHA